MAARSSSSCCRPATRPGPTTADGSRPRLAAAWCRRAGPRCRTISVMAKPQPIAASQFHARPDLPDWRFMVNSIETTFRAGSFEAAASLIASIAAAAEAADHHPDIDMRYPDRVHVRLATHTAGGVTDR